MADLFLLLIRPPPISTLFPYTTLFRSVLVKMDAVFSAGGEKLLGPRVFARDRKSTRLNSSHLGISYAVFCLKKKQTNFSLFPSYHITQNYGILHMHWCSYRLT